MCRSCPRLQIRASGRRGGFRGVSGAHRGSLISRSWGAGWYLLLLTALASLGFESAARPGFPSWDFTIHPSVTLRHLVSPRVDAGATERLSGQEPRPLTLATADFDGDGARDLLVGYGAPGMGRVTLFGGVPDGDPLTGEPLRFPFARTETSVDLNASPEFLEVGDFDADGYQDWVAGQSGSSRLFWSRGDGSGLFHQPRSVELTGPLSALASGDVNRRDGLEDLLVGVGGDSPRLLVFEGPSGALQSDPEEFLLEAMPSGVAFGQLDDHYALDLVVAAGYEIVVIHGRDRKLSQRKSGRPAPEPEITRIPFSSEVESIAVGDFISDAAGQKDFVVLTRAGQLLLLGDPLRSQERPVVLGSLGPRMESLAGQPRGFETRSRKLLCTRLSSLPIDAPLVLDAGSGDAWLALDQNSELRRLEMAPSEAPRVATIPLSLPGSVVAALPMRIGAGALDDLVWLSSTSPFPQVTLSGPGGQFQVNVSEDEDDGTCNAGHCSLREAISASNASAGLDTITFSVSTATIGSAPAAPITDAVNVVGPAEIVGTLLLNGGNSEIRGLTGGSVSLGVGNNRVVSSQLSSVSLLSSDNTVGGTSSSDRNVISGSGVIGVFINSDSNQVQGD